MLGSQPALVWRTLWSTGCLSDVSDRNVVPTGFDLHNTRLHLFSLHTLSRYNSDFLLHSTKFLPSYTTSLLIIYSINLLLSWLSIALAQIFDSLSLKGILSVPLFLQLLALQILSIKILHTIRTMKETLFDSTRFKSQGDLDRESKRFKDMLRHRYAMGIASAAMVSMSVIAIYVDVQTGLSFRQFTRQA